MSGCFFTLICPSCLFKQTVHVMFMVLKAELHSSVFECSSPAGGSVVRHSLSEMQILLFQFTLKFAEVPKKTKTLLK